MNKKNKTLYVLDIVFTSILVIGFVYLMILAVELFTSISQYNNENFESLGFALGFVIYLIVAIVLLAPFALSLIVSIAGIRKEIRLCKWCLIIGIAIIVLTYLCLLIIYILAVSNGIINVQ